MAYMGKQKSGSVFAIRRGRLIKRAREGVKMSQGELADLLDMTRNNLSMLESGLIEELTEARCRTLIATLGLNPSELTEDPNMLGADFLPEASFQARRVGRLWDSLPEPLRDYLMRQIEAYTALAAKHPLMAQIAGGTPANESMQVHEPKRT